MRSEPSVPSSTPRPRARALAFYLPQFHPIPENDEFWGPGFTEWTNVARARPLYRGHVQPRLPGSLGFYDLRLPETRRDQADLARASGVEGFVYWHYWFAGRRVLERPFREVLASGEPDFPFALGWANESWSGIWHGNPGRTLIRQTYPGAEDTRRHFAALEAAFHDPRYVRVADRPLFYLYRPFQLPSRTATLELWRSLARDSGFDDLYILAQVTKSDLRIHDLRDFDGVVLANFGLQAPGRIRSRWIRVRRRPWIVDYAQAWPDAVPTDVSRPTVHPTVLPNWDNTPRSGIRGRVYENATPEVFRRQLDYALSMIAHKPEDTRLVFLKSWNEWAEGNYLEPDFDHGHAWLDATRAVLLDSDRV
jgi:lipopolysaccharide biosynthesis protein